MAGIARSDGKQEKQKPRVRGFSYVSSYFQKKKKADARSAFGEVCAREAGALELWREWPEMWPHGLGSYLFSPFPLVPARAILPVYHLLLGGAGPGELHHLPGLEALEKCGVLHISLPGPIDGNFRLRGDSALVSDCLVPGTGPVLPPFIGSRNATARKGG
jgi:hypothetical protein